MDHIALSKTDRQFKYEILAKPGAHRFSRCFSCGTCTASCPVSEVDESFNPRMVIRKALLGLREELLSSRTLWHCAQCYTCYARCPQDVRFTDIMSALREMAVDEGFASPALLADMKQVDVQAQRIRHELADLAYDRRTEAVGDPEAHADRIQELLEDSITRIGNDG